MKCPQRVRHEVEVLPRRHEADVVIRVPPELEDQRRHLDGLRPRADEAKDLLRAAEEVGHFHTHPKLVTMLQPIEQTVATTDATRYVLMPRTSGGRHNRGSTLVKPNQITKLPKFATWYCQNLDQFGRLWPNTHRSFTKKRVIATISEDTLLPSHSGRPMRSLDHQSNSVFKNVKAMPTTASLRSKFRTRT